MREKRNKISQDRKLVEEVLRDGQKKAKITASRTMEEVRAAIKI